ncbi:MAG TPA: di-heme oxidoredictase family protein [Blastocatellia bacterium]|nr:di-heme oxidoredictase family protein [Blastocatellia bacterium]
MRLAKSFKLIAILCFAGVIAAVAFPVFGQLIDRTRAPNAANVGIAKSYQQQAGVGRGNVMTPDSSLFLINRDPARSIRRGRQLFQRKFSRSQGLGPSMGDGAGDINTVKIIGAGLADSCAACHGRPRGSAGAGGDVVTRPDSRDAPHLFGLGLKEMLADEITADLRMIRAVAIARAQQLGSNFEMQLMSKGINYGRITARPNGTVDTTAVDGVNPDLRIRPFFLHGETISIREFAVGAFQAEMGLQSVDPDTAAAHNGGVVTTPSGMVLDGTKDAIEAPPTSDPLADPDGDGVVNEVPTSIVDFMEHYLLNYFKAGLDRQTDTDLQGRQLFVTIGCAQCHIPDLQIARDRRHADLETVFDPVRGNPINQLFATASPLFNVVNDGTGLPTLKVPRRGVFRVNNIFTDFKRHDLGINFYEINFDGTMQREFLTTALWGLGTTAPYGHDGRSHNLASVIARHGGEALDSRNQFLGLSTTDRDSILSFLRTLILFPPDDTASSLDPINPSVLNYPQFGHGSIRLGALFNNPADPE